MKTEEKPERKREKPQSGLSGTFAHWMVIYTCLIVLFSMWLYAFDSVPLAQSIRIATRAASVATLVSLLVLYVALPSALIMLGAVMELLDPEVPETPTAKLLKAVRPPKRRR